MLYSIGTKKVHSTHHKRYFAFGEDIRTLRLTSKLVYVRVEYDASYLCRGIEAVITGLTRNQFVDNTTRGFESLPLRQQKNALLSTKTKVRFLNDVCLRQMMWALPNDER